MRAAFGDFDPSDDFDNLSDPDRVDHGDSWEDNDGWETSDSRGDSDGRQEGGGADHRNNWNDVWNDDCYVKWSSLSFKERKVYDDLARPYRSEYLGLLRKYNVTVPLSPSLQSKGTGLGISLKYDPERNTFATEDGNWVYEDVGPDGPPDVPTFVEFLHRWATVDWNKYRRDDPHACGLVATPVPAHSFPFFKLPPEVRALILSFCLRRDKVIWQRAEWSCFDYHVEEFSDRPVDTRLFAVSSQMRSEAEEVFYSVNEFALIISEDEDLPHFISSPPSTLQSLRHMTVVVVLRASKGDRRSKEKLKTVWSILQQCTHLSYLRLIGFHPDDTYPDLDEEGRGLMKTYTKELLGPYASSPAIATLEVLYFGSPNQDLGCLYRLIGPLGYDRCEVCWL